jgi:hypothetical protein
MSAVIRQRQVRVFRHRNDPAGNDLGFEEFLDLLSLPAATDGGLQA